LSEAELEVDSDRASYKQKLEVLQQQEELIEDEQEQEAREEDARRIKREEEAKLAQSLLPDSEVRHLPINETYFDAEVHFVVFVASAAGGLGPGRWWRY
jgi:LETM1 and EF-hand domain-containing protein 1